MVSVRTDCRNVSAAAVYCSVAVERKAVEVAASGRNKDRYAKGARNKDKNAIGYAHVLRVDLCYYFDGGGVAGNKLVGGLEQPCGIAGVYGRDRTMDACARRCGDDADRAVFERFGHRRVVGECGTDCVFAGNVGRVDVPRSDTVVGRWSFVVRQQTQTCGGVGDGDIILGDTFAVLRVCAAYVVGRVVRLCADLDRQSVGADSDAFH